MSLAEDVFEGASADVFDGVDSDGVSEVDGVSSNAPVAVGTHTSAETLRRSHPLWERAAGRGAHDGSLPKAPASVVGDGGARFEPLSALTLELNGFRRNADGESSLFSESCKSRNKVPKRPIAKKTPVAQTCANDDGADGDRMLAAAAFGNVGCDEGSDSASEVSVADSKQRKRAHRAAFPVKGIECVGCALATQIAPVERFVLENMERMAEDALWKFAALVYIKEVQDPRTREGVLTPPWAWKDIRTHFLLHSSDARIARLSTCRQLQTMRYAVEQRLMRVTDGSREIDKSGCDLMLKIVKAESDQRASLAALAAGVARGRRVAIESTVGDAAH